MKTTYGHVPDRFLLSGSSCRVCWSNIRGTFSPGDSDSGESSDSTLFTGENARCRDQLLRLSLARSRSEPFHFLHPRVAPLVDLVYVSMTTLASSFAYSVCPLSVSSKHYAYTFILSGHENNTSPPHFPSSVTLHLLQIRRISFCTFLLNSIS